MRRPPNALLLVLLMQLLLGPAAAAEPSAGSDKALHALFGASCALLASAVAAPALQGLPQSDLRYALQVSGTGLSAAAAAGVVKELIDLSGCGDPEWLDLLATVAGGLAASAAVFASSAGDRQATPRLAPAYAAFGILLALPPGEALFRRLSSRRSSASSE